MKHIRYIAVIAGMLALPQGLSGQAAAATMSVTQELHVTARVAPRRDIIVDQTGKILEITSNTPEAVKPTVYLMRVSPETRRQLTSHIERQYDKLVPGGASKAGTLYSRGLLSFFEATSINRARNGTI